MLGGYVMIDLTKYGEIDETPVELTNDDFQKMKDCFEGKALLLKLYYNTSITIGVFPITDGEYIYAIPLLDVSSGTYIGNFEILKSTKEIKFMEN